MGKIEKTKIKWIRIIIAVAIVIITLPVLSHAAEKKMFRWGTADPMSYGYKVSAFMADFLRRGMPDYDITVYPFVSTDANIKSFAKGELESTYAAEPNLRGIYSFSGAYKDFERDVKKMPVHSFWAYTMETHILILTKMKDEIRTWEDLKGKKIFRTPAGYGNYLNITRALDIVGVKTEHIEIDTAKVADALKAGTISATAMYTTALVSLPSWGKTLDIATPLWGVNPTPEQREKLAKAGFTPVKINIKKAYAGVEIQKMDELFGVPFYFGYHQGIDIPEETVYRMLKIFESSAPNLAKLDPGFEPLAKEFAKFQALGIASLPEVPVHPGLAKYLKEKGLWNPSWVIATNETIKAAISKMKK